MTMRHVYEMGKVQYRSVTPDSFRRHRNAICLSPNTKHLLLSRSAHQYDEA